ncbi:MAG: hypothetical protein R2909_06530 [Gemmatimonadales bacterium]
MSTPPARMGRRERAGKEPTRPGSRAAPRPSGLRNIATPPTCDGDDGRTQPDGQPLRGTLEPDATAAATSATAPIPTPPQPGTDVTVPARAMVSRMKLRFWIARSCSGIGSLARFGARSVLIDG